jgi:UDP-N-acetylglucosamine--N-acetylmuramyl-(pentapeptide) pyrophosphoryl-undecaprenol N-acetylglucosamine transferase
VTTLFVANDGGHLQQLTSLASRFPGQYSRVWATNDSAQARSLLEDERVYWFPHSPPRDVRAVLRNAVRARRILTLERPSRVISTGSLLGLGILPLAAARGISTHYIESATRVSGPSLSGSILRWIPRIHLYTQYQHLADARWMYRGSVFDDYHAVPPTVHPPPIRRVVVSVGTSKDFGFRRLIERLARLADPAWEVYWQTGSTDVTGLGIYARPAVPTTELRRAIERSDIVVTHAGTGSAIAALEAGKRPILVPRDPTHGEHIDAHQYDIARELERRGLAWKMPVDLLDRAGLEDRRGWRITRGSTPPPFELV